jgi:hypothetical protein
MEWLPYVKDHCTSDSELPLYFASVVHLNYKLCKYVLLENISSEQDGRVVSYFIDVYLRLCLSVCPTLSIPV